MSSSPTGDEHASAALARSRALFPNLQSLHEDLEVYLPDLVIIAGSQILLEVSGALETIAHLLQTRTDATELVARADGEINRRMIRQLIAQANDHRDLVDDALASASRVVRKLLLHTTVPYSDKLHASKMCSSTLRAAAAATALSRMAPVSSTWLVGSMASPLERAWHPVLSDIDLFPLLSRAPTTREAVTIRRTYQQMTNAPLDYMNLGAKVGIGGLRRDPLSTLCIEGKPLLPEERSYRDGLLRGAKQLTGPPQ